MLKSVLFVAAAVAMLYWLSHTANAAEEVKSPSVVIDFPVICMDRSTLLTRLGKWKGYPVWHGVTKDTFLSTLYLNSDGSWVLTQERAMSKTMCILSSGEQNELLGIGGI